LWHFTTPDKTQYSHSEGLALASLALYQSGKLSTEEQSPCRIDAQQLLGFQEQDFMEAFQVTPENSIEGLVGRVQLMKS
jgi:hypothetical protein